MFSYSVGIITKIHLRDTLVIERQVLVWRGSDIGVVSNGIVRESLG